MAVRGADVVVLVDTGTQTPNWTIVGGQRGATLHFETDTVDVTTKGSTGAMREVLPTFVAWTVSCDGLIVNNDTALAFLRNAWKNRNIVKVRFKFAEDDIEEGSAIVRSADFEAPYDDSATYSCEFDGVGALTKVTT